MQLNVRGRTGFHIRNRPPKPAGGKPLAIKLAPPKEMIEALKALKR